MSKLLRTLTCSVSGPPPQSQGVGMQYLGPDLIMSLSAVRVHLLKMAEQDVEDEEEDDAEKNQPLRSTTSADATG